MGKFGKKERSLKNKFLEIFKPRKKDKKLPKLRQAVGTLPKWEVILEKIQDFRNYPLYFQGFQLLHYNAFDKTLDNYIWIGLSKSS